MDDNGAPVRDDAAVYAVGAGAGGMPNGGAGGTQHMQHIFVSQPLQGYEGIDPRSILSVLVKPFYRDQILHVLRKRNMLDHYGVVFRLKDFMRIPQILNQLYSNCDYILSVCTEALRLAQAELLMTPEGFEFELKANVHARFMDVSLVPEIVHSNLRTLNFSQAGDTFMQLTGLVTSVGAVRLIPRRRVYKCSSTGCGYEFTVTVSLEHNNEVKLPLMCPNPDALGNGKNKRKCQNREFIPPVLSGAQGGTYETRRPDGTVIRTALHTDYQEVTLQERLESLGDSRSAPRTITIVLENDLVNSLVVGTDVVVTGKLVNKIFNYQPGQRAVRESVLLANCVRGTSGSCMGLGVSRTLQALHADFQDYWAYWKAVGRPLRGRDVLVRSIAPDLHGMYAVKLAMLLVLIGGCDGLGVDPTQESAQADNEARGVHRQGLFHEEAMHGTGGEGGGGELSGSSSIVRGFCHMLLVGDPGTGKSQLMRFVLDLIPRSIMTTGVSSSAAGLTCTAVREKDGGGFRLEAGALVLADGGVCCVDEFATLKKEDRGSVLEAMEHGCISVAKAGIITKLPTRCSVLGACNPKASTKSKRTGEYDWQAADLSLLTGIDSPLLSRFDLVLLLPDPHTEAWDKAMSGFILSRAAELGLSTFSEYVKECEHQLEQAIAARAQAQTAYKGPGAASQNQSRMQGVQPSQFSVVLGSQSSGHHHGSSSSFTQHQAAIAELDAKVEAAQTAVDDARAMLWAEQEQVRQLNDASGVSCSRYLQLSVDGLKDEGGAKADNQLTIQAVTLGRPADARVSELIQGLGNGSAALHRNRFPDGRRVEDLLVPDARPAATVGGGGGYGGPATGSGPGSHITARNAGTYAAAHAHQDANKPPVYSVAGVDVRWDLVRLQSYIQHVKARFSQVLICAEGTELLQRYYELQRGSDTRSHARTTVRMLEALVRLTQAHARLMYRGVACVQDACVAILVMEYSASTNGSEEHAARSVAQTEFPGNSDHDYAWRERRMLMRLLVGRVPAGFHGGNGDDNDDRVDLSPDTAAAISKQQLQQEQTAARGADGHVGPRGSDGVYEADKPHARGVGVGKGKGLSGASASTAWAPAGQKRPRDDVAVIEDDTDPAAVDSMDPSLSLSVSAGGVSSSYDVGHVKASNWVTHPGPVRHGAEQARAQGRAIPGEHKFYSATVMAAQSRGKIDENSPFTPAVDVHTGKTGLGSGTGTSAANASMLMPTPANNLSFSTSQQQGRLPMGSSQAPPVRPSSMAPPPPPMASQLPVASAGTAAAAGLWNQSASQAQLQAMRPPATPLSAPAAHGSQVSNVGSVHMQPWQAPSMSQGLAASLPYSQPHTTPAGTASLRQVSLGAQPRPVAAPTPSPQLQPPPQPFAQAQAQARMDTPVAAAHRSLAGSMQPTHTPSAPASTPLRPPSSLGGVGVGAAWTGASAGATRAGADGSAQGQARPGPHAVMPQRTPSTASQQPKQAEMTEDDLL